ncbi:MAG: LysR family transcriptional regulator [Rhodocyclaceae bacterium]|nr:LysR family transcriptional regulator [Rhodocyclaceae bacterium]
MRFNQVRDFLAIVDAGSIRAAARAQGVTHPALTKSLRQLEEELGVELIRRSTRGVSLTAMGQAFAARARAIQAEIRKAEEELAALSAPGGGMVSVGLSPTAIPFAADALAEFLEQHPLVRLRVVEGPPSVLVPLVRDESLDFAIAQKTRLTAGAGLRFRPLYRDRMTIACRAQHPARNGTTIDELADLCWLGLNPQGAGSLVEQIFAAAGKPFPRRFVQCESFAFAFELMARTDAVMPVSAPVLASPAAAGRMSEIHIEPPLPPLILGLCSRQDVRPTPPAALLSKSIAERLLSAAARAAKLTR